MGWRFDAGTPTAPPSVHVTAAQMQHRLARFAAMKFSTGAGDGFSTCHALGASESYIHECSGIEVLVHRIHPQQQIKIIGDPEQTVFVFLGEVATSSTSSAKQVLLERWDTLKIATGNECMLRNVTKDEAIVISFLNTMK